MVEDRIRNIEARVLASANLPAESKAELLEVLAEMRAELQAVKPEHLADAEKTGGTGSVTHGETLDDTLGAIENTVTALEANHPRLAALANRLAIALSNMGI